jgi:hypothetical protein
MRWIALHHVAANIWLGDFQENNEENVMNEERASNLFKAFVSWELYGRLCGFTVVEGCGTTSTESTTTDCY